MDKSNPLEDSIAFIESSLTEDINVEVLAEQAFFSKTHYQRLFRAIVGQPAMEYVKNRRLQLACREVLIGNDGILDIALKYGYDSHEGFTRAFRAYFGVSPSDYRKRGKISETEVVKMLSKEVLSRIGQKAELISATLSNFAEGAEKLSAKTYEMAEIKGVGTNIVAKELRNLAQRVRKFKDENVKNLHNGNVSAFEMADKIFIIIKVLDDVAFQMNLLRFFSGIETGRIAPPKDEFEVLDLDYAKLCSKIVERKEWMIDLVYEAIDLLYTDIKQEAINRLESAANAITKAVEEGKDTATSTHIAAEALGERGGAFRYIAKEVSDTIPALTAVAQNYSSANNLHSVPLQHGNLAFSMNICAFNASVEAARAGDVAKCVTAADKIMKYAGVLQNAYLECEALGNEYERLIALTQQKGNRSEQDLSNKRIDDIIFQCGILSSQFALEAERINRDTIRNLAQAANEAYAKLVKTRDVVECHKSVSLFLQNLNNEVSSLEIGGSFAYFAKEYEHFLNRILA
ncbi:MAG: helix-turn-helix domain-containing protein [Defluviitaleaceae bacterium]|nr:helix-turn-helix domain-containing protein [Defluviitaleaceae bacterium]